jgi:uncharacterized protein YPO0396
MQDGYMTVIAPMRDVLDKAMVVALENLSLPSRQQAVSLAERFTNLEMRLDDVDAKLDRLIELSSANNLRPQRLLRSMQRRLNRSRTGRRVIRKDGQRNDSHIAGRKRLVDRGAANQDLEQGVHPEGCNCSDS